VIIIRFACVGGQELASLVHLVTYGWNMMLIAPGSQKAKALSTGLVFCKNVFYMPPQSIFGQEGLGQIHVFLEPEFLRDILEEILHALCSDFFEHLLLYCGYRIGDIGIDSRVFLVHALFLQWSFNVSASFSIII